MATILKKVNYKFSLPVSIIKEGKYFVAYTPALDLSTSAESYEKARERFEEIVEIFFEEVTEKGTLDDVLSSLGWQKVKKQWIPPTVVANETESFTIPLSN